MHVTSRLPASMCSMQNTHKNWLVRTESTISGQWCSNGPMPSPDFSPQLRDKIWEWPGDEARWDVPSQSPEPQHCTQWQLETRLHWVCFKHNIRLCAICTSHILPTQHISCIWRKHIIILTPHQLSEASFVAGASGKIKFHYEWDWIISDHSKSSSYICKSFSIEHKEQHNKQMISHIGS